VKQRQCTILIKDEVICAVMGLEPTHSQLLVDQFAMLVPNRFHMAKFKLGVWDGKIPFFRDAGETYVNLLDQIVPILEDYDYKIKLVDKRVSTVYAIPEIDETLLSHIELNDEPLILRDHQVEVINKLCANGGGVAKASTASGKCLAPDTPIIMFDGSTKQIKDIVVGDKLLGDDNTPRTVLGTTSGRSPMYKISPTRNGYDDWICNDKHILTLVANASNKNVKKNEVIDIGIDEYIKQTPTFKHTTKQFSVGFDGWEESNFRLDPYFIGLWLGDGNTNSSMIWNIDPEIIEYIYEVADNTDCVVTIREQNDKDTECCGYYITSPNWRENPIWDVLKEYRNKDGVKYIPTEYITSSREQRLQLLAGLLDSDGYMDKSGYEIVQKSKPLTESIILLARSLGLRVSCADKIVNDTIYYRMYISGDLSQVPCKVARKQINTHTSERNSLRSGFSVEELAEGDYVGLVVDGNRRFLKSDFTVVHNTFITGALTLIHEALDALRVLTIVPNKTLVKQTHKEYMMLGIDAGIYYGEQKDTDHKHLVSTWQSLIQKPFMMRDYDVVIVDEVHLAKGQSLQDLLIKHGKHIAYRYGVTGTMPKEEIDKMSVNVALGSVVVEVGAAKLIKKGILSNLKINILELEHNLTLEYEKYTREFKKSLTRPKVMSYIEYKDSFLPDYAAEKAYNTQFEPHLLWIVNKLEEIRNTDGNVLVLVDGIKHGQKLISYLDDATFLSGTDKVEDRQAIYEQYATRDDMLTIATAQIASTGLNIKRIFAVVFINFGRSSVKVIQSVGRGLRTDTDKDSVNVYDITTDMKYCRKHTTERIKFYKEEEYPHTKKKIKFAPTSSGLFEM